MPKADRSSLSKYFQIGWDAKIIDEVGVIEAPISLHQRNAGKEIDVKQEERASSSSATSSSFHEDPVAMLLAEGLSATSMRLSDETASCSIGQSASLDVVMDVPRGARIPLSASKDSLSTTLDGIDPSIDLRATLGPSNCPSELPCGDRRRGGDCSEMHALLSDEERCRSCGPGRVVRLYLLSSIDAFEPVLRLATLSSAAVGDDPTSALGGADLNDDAWGSSIRTRSSRESEKTGGAAGGAEAAAAVAPNCDIDRRFDARALQEKMLYSRMADLSGPSVLLEPGAILVSKTYQG